MILHAIVEETVRTLHIPDELLVQGEEFFAKLDADMACGWQMSREWVAQPDGHQRCQIVADKLLTALETENERLGLLMAGYLLSRMPGLTAVELDVHGEMQNHRFRLAAVSAEVMVPESARATAAAGADPAVDPAAAVLEIARRTRPGVKLSKLEALAQAGEEVTKVFRVGKGWRFAVLDPLTTQWHDAPLAATAAEAERLRQQVFGARYAALLGGEAGQEPGTQYPLA